MLYYFEVIRISDNTIIRTFSGIWNEGTENNLKEGVKDVKLIGETKIYVENFDGTNEEIELE